MSTRNKAPQVEVFTTHVDVRADLIAGFEANNPDYRYSFVPEDVSARFLAKHKMELVDDEGQPIKDGKVLAEYGDKVVRRKREVVSEETVRGHQASWFRVQRNLMREDNDDPEMAKIRKRKKYYQRKASPRKPPALEEEQDDE